WFVDGSARPGRGARTAVFSAVPVPSALWVFEKLKSLGRSPPPMRLLSSTLVKSRDKQCRLLSGSGGILPLGGRPLEDTQMEQNVRTITPDHNQIRTEVVTTYEQLLHAYAIRSICFMEEHGVKAQQAFDGNDYQATHMIVYAGAEPIGTLRIR